mmetsp:Transcript_3117/g.9493  ORF Transcript_3117/g.9493 Transcript_3117/m.9493 type:complete len:104 (+) Transcript_3117:4016-4327(+)
MFRTTDRPQCRSQPPAPSLLFRAPAARRLLDSSSYEPHEPRSVEPLTGQDTRRFVLLAAAAVVGIPPFGMPPVVESPPLRTRPPAALPLAGPTAAAPNGREAK